MRKPTGSGHLFQGLLLIAAVCLALSTRAWASSPLDFAALMPHSAGDCVGSIAECLAWGGGGDGDWGEEVEEEELAMDSETNRRILAWRRRYISYGALRRNAVPCSRRGASYYNCRPGARVNPYSRACSRITRCRS